MDFQEALETATHGLETWRAKPHNARWWRRIDGTPIPNDLLVNIAEAFVSLRAATANPHPAPIQTLDDQIPSSSPVLGVGREEIARLVDPAEWERIDRHRRAREPEGVLKIWAAPSLTKADAILSLLVGGRGDSSSNASPSGALPGANTEAEPAGPICRLDPDDGQPAWAQIVDLFNRHGLSAPPTKLRDELVVHLAWARYGETLNANTEAEPAAAVANWMITHSYATGHGDTIEDMLGELEWQAKERGNIPDLLEALKLGLGRMEMLLHAVLDGSDHPTATRYCIARARAAIAKATGGAS